MTWFFEFDPALQSAVVAGSVAVLTAVIAAVNTLTTAMLQSWLSGKALEKQRQNEQLRVYKRYAHPLVSSATSLYWRLREVFELGGGAYLTRDENLTVYETYKIRSTIYRLAALLGWIRALRRELFLVGELPETAVSGLREALNGVEAALADGGNVELARVAAICQILELQQATDAALRAQDSLGRDLDAHFKAFLRKANVAEASQLTEEDQRLLCEEVALLIGRACSQSVCASRVDQSVSQIVAVLSIRECWIYRDWQSAIGDVAIRSLGGGDTSFEVVSYSEFEYLCDHGPSADRLWVRRLLGLVIGLDVKGDAGQDARIAQLSGFYVALASMLLAFHDSKVTASFLRRETLDALHKTIEWSRA